MCTYINNTGAYSTLLNRLEPIYPADFEKIGQYVLGYFSLHYEECAYKTAVTVLGSLNRFLYWCEKNQTDLSCINQTKFSLYIACIEAKRKNIKPEIRIVTQLSQHILQKMQETAERETVARTLVLLSESC